MTVRSLQSSVYIAALALTVVSGFRFAASGEFITRLGEGFFRIDASDGSNSRSREEFFRCDELLSTGGDDKAVTILAAALVLPLLIRLIRFRSAAGRSEILTFALVSAATLIAMGFLTGCGEYITTLWYSANMDLRAMFLSWTIAAGLVIWGLREAEA